MVVSYLSDVHKSGMAWSYSAFVLAHNSEEAIVVGNRRFNTPDPRSSGG